MSAVILRRLGRWLRRFIEDPRGGAELNTYLLLTAAGCAMVGVTLPSMLRSSKTASDSFETQVEILQRGASTGVGGRGAFDLGGLGQLAVQVGTAAVQSGGAGASGSPRAGSENPPTVTAEKPPPVEGPKGTSLRPSTQTQTR